MSSTVEKREFQTEIKQLLDLMVHSLYSNKDIFLRELISNSSDALDKRRFESLNHKEVQSTSDSVIKIDRDEKNRVLVIEDNGIGMNREEVVQNIGTIAKSGTREFADALKQQAEGSEQKKAELIGQFGVGFYSVFMVADEVKLETCRAGETTGTCWISKGDGSYTLEDLPEKIDGTRITLKLKAVDEENAIKDYCQEWVIRDIVKKYSDFVAYPIQMQIQREEVERDKDGKVVEGSTPKTITTLETLNSMKAIWTRPKSEVKDEEYKEFYKHISHDWNNPLEVISLSLEGTFEARALLFIPEKAPFDLFYREMNQKGLHLYVKRVSIMEDCAEILPEYLRFVRGVVDAEDLALNVSREILQQDRQIRAIRKRVIRKVLDTLKQMKEKEFDRYVSFWNEFGKVLKEGLIRPDEYEKDLLDLMLVSTLEEKEKLVDLKSYVDGLNESQKDIYFLTGASRAMIEKSPYLEGFRAQKVNVCFFTDRVDEIWTQNPVTYLEKTFKSVGKGEIDLNVSGKDEADTKKFEEKEKEVKDLMGALAKKLETEVKSVRVSRRLKDSPVCLVREEGEISPQLEEILKASGQEVPQIKGILEINPDHNLIVNLNAMFRKDPTDPKLEMWGRLLHGQALLAQGSEISDSAGFSQALADLMLTASRQTEK